MAGTLETSPRARRAHKHSCRARDEKTRRRRAVHPASPHHAPPHSPAAAAATDRLIATALSTPLPRLWQPRVWSSSNAMKTSVQLKLSGWSKAHSIKQIKAAAPPPAHPCLRLPPAPAPPARGGTRPCAAANASGCMLCCSTAPRGSRRSGAGRWWRRSQGRRRCGGRQGVHVLGLWPGKAGHRVALAGAPGLLQRHTHPVSRQKRASCRHRC